MRNVHQLVSDFFSQCILSNLSKFVALVFSQRWMDYEFFLNTLERTCTILRCSIQKEIRCFCRVIDINIDVHEKSKTYQLLDVFIFKYYSFENKKYSILHTIFTQYLKLEICTSILFMGIIKLVPTQKNKVYIKVQNNIYANHPNDA